MWTRSVKKGGFPNAQATSNLPTLPAASLEPYSKSIPHTGSQGWAPRGHLQTLVGRAGCALSPLCLRDIGLA